MNRVTESQHYQVALLSPLPLTHPAWLPVGSSAGPPEARSHQCTGAATQDPSWGHQCPQAEAASLLRANSQQVHHSVEMHYWPSVLMWNVHTLNTHSPTAHTGTDMHAHTHKHTCYAPTPECWARATLCSQGLCRCLVKPPHLFHSQPGGRAVGWGAITGSVLWEGWEAWLSQGFPWRDIPHCSPGHWALSWLRWQASGRRNCFPGDNVVPCAHCHCMSSPRPQVLWTQWAPGVNSLSPQAGTAAGGGKSFALPLSFVLGSILERYIGNVILISNCSLLSFIPQIHTHRCTQRHTCTDTLVQDTDTYMQTCMLRHTGTETQVHRHAHARHTQTHT